LFNNVFVVVFPNVGLADVGDARVVGQLGFVEKLGLEVAGVQGRGEARAQGLQQRRERVRRGVFTASREVRAGLLLHRLADRLNVHNPLRFSASTVRTHSGRKGA